MSRLDKQLDRLSGEKLVQVEWLHDDSVDVVGLREMLMKEIDAHSHRVPLDLRSVNGAPNELVELLFDMRRYAMSKSKILSTTYMLAPLREALDRRLSRPIGSRARPSADPENEMASDTAQELLRDVESKTEYDLSKAKKIKRKRRRTHRQNERLLRLGVVVLAAATIIAAAEAIYLFQSGNDPIVIPRKGFEKQN